MTRNLKLSALLIFISAALSACSHSVTLRASHFATPIVADDQWGGQLSLVGTSVTKVTLVNDLTSNPPLRNSILINDDIDIADSLYINRLSIDGRLTVWSGLEAYIDGALWGLRYQFLNHQGGTNKWVASALVAAGNRKSETSRSWGSSTAEGESEVKSRQAGLSVGYKFEDVVPYISYIHEKHEAETKVMGTNGNFGPYYDSGIHQYYSIGITSHKKGLAYAAEYSRIYIDWEDGSPTNQDAFGLKIGLAW